MTRDASQSYAAHPGARHAQFQVPESVVARMIQSATGLSAVERLRCERVTDGADSEVYAVTMPEHPTGLIVKIQQGDTSPLAQEAWALEAARDAGLPVPGVLIVDRVLHEGESWAYLVETTVPGRSLAEQLPSLGSRQRRGAFRQMGHALAQLHRVRVGGFWKRQPTGEWDFPTWEAVMASTLRERQAEAAELHHAGFTASQADRVFAWIARYAEEFPCRTPVLCHGDFLPEHVFFDGTGRLTGVIDFGMYFGGDPVSDLAVVRMDLDASAFDAVVEGYGADTALGDRFELHLHLSLLTTEVGYLLYHMRLPDRRGAARYATGLWSTLRWLDAQG